MSALPLGFFLNVAMFFLIYLLVSVLVQFIRIHRAKKKNNYATTSRTWSFVATSVLACVIFFGIFMFGTSDAIATSLQVLWLGALVGALLGVVVR